MSLLALWADAHSILLCTSGRFSSLVGSVRDLQAWHLTEMFQITAGQYRAVRQGDAGDEQIGSADPLQLLVLPKPVELRDRCHLDGEDKEMFQISFILRKPLLGQQEFLTILRFQYGGEPTLENL